jgi:4-hydroxybenzoate polyprenyltransferase
MMALLEAMRPLQWSKNLFVFTGLVFAGKLSNPGLFLITAAAFLCFCAVSSAAYLLNDLVDVERDRLHPRKRMRPLASGRLSRSSAALAAAALAAGGLAAAFLIRPQFGRTALAYCLLMAAYSLLLKREAVLELFVIAAGYVLRAAGGAAAIAVHISPWMLSCATLMALFLVLCKRRAEVFAAEAPEQHRESHAGYTPQLLDQMIAVATAATIVTYMLYAFQSETARTHAGLLWTVPFVIYGMFRYLFLVYVRGQGENPESLILKDPHLLGSLVLWGGLAVFLLWGN